MQEGGEGEPLVGRFVVYRQPPAPPLRRYHVVELVDGALVNAPPLPADAAWLTPVPQLAVFTLGWRVLETADGAVGVMVANAAVSAAGDVLPVVGGAVPDAWLPPLDAAATVMPPATMDARFAVWRRRALVWQVVRAVDGRLRHEPPPVAAPPVTRQRDLSLPHSPVLVTAAGAVSLLRHTFEIQTADGSFVPCVSGVPAAWLPRLAG
jgi:hypothetical protein